MTPLRQRMPHDMQVCNLAENTKKSYLIQVTSFARHFHRSPELLGPEETRPTIPKRSSGFLDVLFFSPSSPDWIGGRSSRTSLGSRFIPLTATDWWGVVRLAIAARHYPATA
ncbi:hypothetical protein [Paraburkholderia sacchari]|uniref:hypothetical protein n=1 Tax=Paraburkholderia sacchari TaxID=159450 RepID=UPI003D96E657